MASSLATLLQVSSEVLEDEESLQQQCSSYLLNGPFKAQSAHVFCDRDHPLSVPFGARFLVNFCFDQGSDSKLPNAALRRSISNGCLRFCVNCVTKYVQIRDKVIEAFTEEFSQGFFELTSYLVNWDYDRIEDALLRDDRFTATGSEIRMRRLSEHQSAFSDSPAPPPNHYITIAFLIIRDLHFLVGRDWSREAHSYVDAKKADALSCGEELDVTSLEEVIQHADILDARRRSIIKELNNNNLASDIGYAYAIYCIHGLSAVNDTRRLIKDNETHSFDISVCNQMTLFRGMNIIMSWFALWADGGSSEGPAVGVPWSATRMWSCALGGGDECGDLVDIKRQIMKSFVLAIDTERSRLSERRVKVFGSESVPHPSLMDGFYEECFELIQRNVTHVTNAVSVWSETEILPDVQKVFDEALPILGLLSKKDALGCTFSPLSFCLNEPMSEESPVRKQLDQIAFEVANELKAATQVATKLQSTAANPLASLVMIGLCHHLFQMLCCGDQQIRLQHTSGLINSFSYLPEWVGEATSNQLMSCLTNAITTLAEGGDQYTPFVPMVISLCSHLARLSLDLEALGNEDDKGIDGIALLEPLTNLLNHLHLHSFSDGVRSYAQVYLCTTVLELSVIDMRKNRHERYDCGRKASKSIAMVLATCQSKLPLDLMNELSRSCAFFIFRCLSSKVSTFLSFLGGVDAAQQVFENLPRAASQPPHSLDIYCGEGGSISAAFDAEWQDALAGATSPTSNQPIVQRVLTVTRTSLEGGDEVDPLAFPWTTEEQASLGDAFTMDETSSILMEFIFTSLYETVSQRSLGVEVLNDVVLITQQATFLAGMIQNNGGAIMLHESIDKLNPMSFECHPLVEREGKYSSYVDIQMDLSTTRNLLISLSFPLLELSLAALQRLSLFGCAILTDGLESLQLFPRASPPSMSDMPIDLGIFFLKTPSPSSKNTNFKSLWKVIPMLSFVSSLASTDCPFTRFLQYVDALLGKSYHGMNEVWRVEDDSMTCSPIHETVHHSIWKVDGLSSISSDRQQDLFSYRIAHLSGLREVITMHSSFVQKMSLHLPMINSMKPVPCNSTLMTSSSCHASVLLRRMLRFLYKQVFFTMPQYHNKNRLGCLIPPCSSELSKEGYEYSETPKNVVLSIEDYPIHIVRNPLFDSGCRQEHHPWKLHYLDEVLQFDQALTDCIASVISAGPSTKYNPLEPTVQLYNFGYSPNADSPRQFFEDMSHIHNFLLRLTFGLKPPGPFAPGATETSLYHMPGGYKSWFFEDVRYLIARLCPFQPETKVVSEPRGLHLWMRCFRVINKCVLHLKGGSSELAASEALLAEVLRVISRFISKGLPSTDPAILDASLTRSKEFESACHFPLEYSVVPLVEGAILAEVQTLHPLQFPPSSDGSFMMPTGLIAHPCASLLTTGVSQTDCCASHYLDIKATPSLTAAVSQQSRLLSLPKTPTNEAIGVTVEKKATGNLHQWLTPATQGGNKLTPLSSMNRPSAVFSHSLKKRILPHMAGKDSVTRRMLSKIEERSGAVPGEYSGRPSKQLDRNQVQKARVKYLLDKKLAEAESSNDDPKPANERSQSSSTVGSSCNIRKGRSDDPNLKARLKAKLERSRQSQKISIVDLPSPQRRDGRTVKTASDVKPVPGEQKSVKGVISPEDFANILRQSLSSQHVFMQRLFAFNFLHLSKSIQELENENSTLTRVTSKFACVASYHAAFEPLVLEECSTGMMHDVRESTLSGIPVRISEINRVSEWFNISLIFDPNCKSPHAEQYKPQTWLGEFPNNSIIILTLRDAASASPSSLQGVTLCGEVPALKEKYIIAYVEFPKYDDQVGVKKGTTHGSLRLRIPLNIPITSSAGHINRVLSSTQILMGSLWYAHKITSITPAIREQSALYLAQRSPLFSFVMDPNRPAATLPLSVNLNKIKNDVPLLGKTNNLNPHQLDAIMTALTVPEGVALLHGPPGTGKTQTLLTLLGVLVQRDKVLLKTSTTDVAQPGRLMVCAPSNSAVDEIAARILQEGLAVVNASGEVTRYQPTCLRIGQPKKITRPEVLEISMEEQIMKNSKEAKIGNKEDHDKELEELDSKLTTLDQDIERAKQFGPESGLLSLTAMYTLRRNLVKDKQGQWDEYKAKQKSSFGHSRDALIRNADILFCTLSSSGSDHLSNVAVDWLLVDEAAQAVEPSTLIPLRLGVRRMVLIGDPQQLPSTVLSKRAGEAGYSRSLFERLQESPRVKPSMLKIQYRMQNTICSFPSRYFYNNDLITADAVAERKRLMSYLNTLVFAESRIFHLNGIETRDRRGSVTNPQEAEFVVTLLTLFAEIYVESLRSTPFSLTQDKVQSFQCVKPCDVGVITPYKAQALLIRNMIATRLRTDLGEFEVATIDSFQGREKRMVIFSSVRSGEGHEFVNLWNAENDIRAWQTSKPSSIPKAQLKREMLQRIGFVADERRLNVGLTRARDCLIVVGNTKTLHHSPAWKAFIDMYSHGNSALKANNAKTIASLKSGSLRGISVYDLMMTFWKPLQTIEGLINDYCLLKKYLSPFSLNKNGIFNTGKDLHSAIIRLSENDSMSLVNLLNQQVDNHTPMQKGMAFSHMLKEVELYTRLFSEALLIHLDSPYNRLLPTQRSIKPPANDPRVSVVHSPPAPPQRLLAAPPRPATSLVARESMKRSGPVLSEEGRRVKAKSAVAKSMERLRRKEPSTKDSIMSLLHDDLPSATKNVKQKPPVATQKSSSLLQMANDIIPASRPFTPPTPPPTQMSGAAQQVSNSNAIPPSNNIYHYDPYSSRGPNPPEGIPPSVVSGGHQKYMAQADAPTDPPWRINK
eukprot:GHVH01006211.1.p1 GENE.GHVH01006211.1~~GHVH01006211.1.p1  ORF type:complete len:2813 (+),score=423.19 GHVH01006211.1:984-9422(+)